MAVSLKVPDNYGESIALLFGVSKESLTSAKSHGVEIVAVTGCTFLIKHGGLTYGTVVIKAQTITLAEAGKLGPNSLQAIKFGFENAINKALSSLTASDSPIESAPMDKPSVSVTVKPDDVQGVSALPSTKPPSAVKKTTTKSSSDSAILGIMDSACIDLKDATKLFQPVHGTSSGSRYYVAALLQGGAIALRKDGTKLSVRIICPSLSSAGISRLGEVGLTAKSGYYSCHYDIPATDKLLAHKTVGAIFGALGFSLIREIASLEPIIGDAA